MPRRTAAADLPTPSGTRNPPIGAIVIGGDYQGLGIVRSLGRHKVPVCVIDDECSIARFSKYATHAVRAPNLREESETVETLLAIGRRLKLQGWLLYPTRDETVAAISRNRARLLEFFRVPTAEWLTIQWAWDKRNTYRLGVELDIPTPRVWCSDNVADLRSLDVKFPVAIKPAIKEKFIYATKVKAWRANNHTELDAAFARAARLIEPSEIIIQELIPGDGRHQFAYCSFFKQGGIAASMVVRRARQHPPEFGRASTYVETTDLPILESMSKRFLRAINYYGLVELEYKLDPRDGQYKLLDVNARTWGYHSLGSRAGVDFPYLLYADQLGIPLNQQRGQVGISWIRFVTDCPSAVLEMLAGRLNWREYIDSLRNADVEAVFCREDLLPGIVELLLIPYLSVRRGF